MVYTHVFIQQHQKATITITHFTIDIYFVQGVVFKVITGNGKSAISAWKSGIGSTSDKSCRNISSTTCTDHYRDPRVDDWDALGVIKVLSNILKLFSFIGSQFLSLVTIKYIYMGQNICVALNCCGISFV